MQQRVIHGAVVSLRALPLLGAAVVTFTLVLPPDASGVKFGKRTLSRKARQGRGGAPAEPDQAEVADAP